MTAPDRVCLMILFHRKTGMSFQDFDAYWRNTHARVVYKLPIFKKKILRYEQIHIDQASAQSWREKAIK
ncbi:MAG: hypothetical protein L6R42_003417 [Xanthoria sp. 1 TBL-2021]|nr:MAG: hypothetical protein L6R42_003417 [Xanthoria sp. 1 TBL-2021]